VKKKILILLSLTLLPFIIFFFFFSYSFLAISKPVNSDTVLIEAWISANEIEQIVDKYIDPETRNILLVGKIKGKPIYDAVSPHPEWTYVNDLHTGKNNMGVHIWANSCLIIDPSKYPNTKQNDSLSIRVKASGSIAKNRFPFFNLIINGKHLSGTFTVDTLQTFNFTAVLREEKLRSVGIQFDNDLKTKNEDRNLFIYSIIINGHEIVVNNQNATIIRDGEKMPTGFSSQAELRANYLRALGINKNRIQTISYKPSSYNKTLSSAIALNKYLKKTKFTSFNTFSAGIHARRTWFTYKKVFGNDYNIGIISLNTSKFEQHNWWKSREGILMMMDEITSYSINWIKLTF
jgi:hypothetical protein